MSRFPMAAALAVLLLPVAGGAGALAGTPPKPPKPPKDQPEVKVPADWVRCAKCGMLYPKSITCPNCPPEGFEKCAECGVFHPKGKKCPSCAQQKIPRRSALCPVCRKAFTPPISFNRNAKGGMDRDFCRHSLGKNVVEALVWTCPRCGHTDWCSEMREGKEYPGKFNEAVLPSYAERVRKEVEPAFAKLLGEEVARGSAKLQQMVAELDQLDMPDWVKYHAGVQCAQLRGEPNAVLAKLALEGAYACRRELVKAVDLPVLSRIIPAMEGLVMQQGGTDDDPRTVTKVVIDALRSSEEAERSNPRAALNAWEKYYLYLRLAGCWDRLGDPRLAGDALDEAAKAVKSVRVDPRSAKSMEELVAQRKRMLDREEEFRKQGAGWLRRALIEDNAYPGGAVVPTVYLMGEICRRQGEYGKARPWLVLSAKMAGRGSVLSGMVDEALKLPSMAGAPLDDKEEETVLALVVRLTGKQPGELLTPDPVRPGTSPAAVSGRPAGCADCLAKIYKAYAACVEKNRAGPEEAADLVKGGFITAEAAGDFKCPDCGSPLRYRRPKKPTASDELLMWHPKAAGCKALMLYADGKVLEGQ